LLWKGETVSAEPIKSEYQTKSGSLEVVVEEAAVGEEETMTEGARSAERPERGSSSAR